jgi:Tfp pilus assembly protein PilF
MRLLWRKTVLYFNNFEVPDNEDMYSFARYSWVLRLPLLSFGLVFALGLAAMIFTARGLGRLSFVIFYLGSAVSVIAFFVSSRYRAPALPALLPFAGAMLPWLADSYRASSARRAPRRSVFPPRLAGGLALILAAFALTLYPIHHSDSKNEAAQGLVNLGVLYYHEGDTARAVATFEEALRTYPGQAEASRNLGIIMFCRDSIDRAFQLLSDAARTDPSTPSTTSSLAESTSAGDNLRPPVSSSGRRSRLRPNRSTSVSSLPSHCSSSTSPSRPLPSMTR